MLCWCPLVLVCAVTDAFPSLAIVVGFNYTNATASFGSLGVFAVRAVLLGVWQIVRPLWQDKMADDTYTRISREGGVVLLRGIGAFAVVHCVAGGQRANKWVVFDADLLLSLLNFWPFKAWDGAPSCQAWVASGR